MSRYWWTGRFRALRHRRTQTILAVIAIGAAVALPVVLLSVGGGVYQREARSLEASGYQVTVTATGAHGIGDAHGLAARIDALPDVLVASPILSVPIDLFGAGSRPVPVLAEGVIPAPFLATQTGPQRALLPKTIDLGDPTDQSHYANGTYSGPMTARVLLSSALAQSLAVGPGQSVVLAPSANRSLGESFNVTGLFGLPPTLLGPAALYVVLMPLSDLQTLTGLARSATGGLLDSADTVQVALAGSAATDPTAIARVGAAIHGLAPYYGIATLTGTAAALRSANAILTGFYLGLSSTGLAVGLLFLVIVQLRRVEQDRRAIGIKRAIGVSSWRIAREIAGEAVTLSAAGTAAGLAGGILVVELLAAYGSPSVARAARFAVYDPVTLGSLALALVLLATIASLVPTRRALRLSLPEVLR
jgi:putative ABC transport system permease protein